jgi:quercetin dioxygenase-like cupin family protein
MLVRHTTRLAVALQLIVPPAVFAQDKPVPTAVWVPKPIALAGYTPPQRPWIKLPELRAAHRGEANWRELLVNDGRLMAEYVSAAPGTVVSRRFHPDTREWFAVVEGQVRVEIEGQAPFVATRGSLVNIPRLTIYSMETVGPTPSLRFIVNVANARTAYPADVTPPAPPPGLQWMETRALRRVQQAASEHPRGGGAQREVLGRPIRARRQVGDAGVVRAREEPAAARPFGQGPLPCGERGILARVRGEDPLRLRRPGPVRGERG